MGYDLYVRQGEQLSDDEDGYYRWNVAGMGTLRDLLLALDVLEPEESNCFEDGSYDDACRRHGDGELPADVLSSMLGRTANSGRVPVYKLCSNDGWIVTPAECLRMAEALSTEEAVVAAQRVLGTDDLEWVGDYTDGFAAFCRLAAAHGGFEVH